MELEFKEYKENKHFLLDEDLDELTYEPEWCEHCSAMAEESGYDYEFNVTWECGMWHCDDCGGGC